MSSPATTPILTPAQTFAASHSGAELLSGPVEDISARDFLESSGLAKGELHCLIGGPPCQAFSVYNHQRGMHDERSGLFHEYLRLVDGLMPEWVVMENVTGITSVGGGQAVEAIISGLARRAIGSKPASYAPRNTASRKNAAAFSSLPTGLGCRSRGPSRHTVRACFRSSPYGMPSETCRPSQTARIRAAPYPTHCFRDQLSGDAPRE